MKDSLNSIFLENSKAKELLLESTTKLRSHAVLIYGDSGLGKMTLARLFACRYICGEDAYKDDKAFFESDECDLVMREIHPDMIVLGKESAIKVDDIRKLIVWTGYKPNQAMTKVCILKNCETMTGQASNALLKTLEEPPIDTAIIMHCNKVSKILPTILSRVQSIKVEAVNTDQCKAYLKDRYKHKSADDIDIAVQIYGGNIGECIKFLEDENQLSPFKIADNIAQAIYKKSPFDMARAFGTIKSDRALFLEVLDKLDGIMHKAIVAKYSESIDDRYTAMSGSVSYRYIGSIIKMLDELRRDIVYNPNMVLTYSWLSTQLWIMLENE